jgi:hypothetical protein
VIAFVARQEQSRGWAPVIRLGAAASAAAILERQKTMAEICAAAGSTREA